MVRVFFTADARSDLDDALVWYAIHAPEIVPEFRESLAGSGFEDQRQSQAVSRIASPDPPGVASPLSVSDDIPGDAHGRICRRRFSYEPQPKDPAKSNGLLTALS